MKKQIYVREWFMQYRQRFFLMKVYLLSRAEGLLLHSRSGAAMQIIINTLHFSSTLYPRSALQARTALSLTVSGRNKGENRNRHVAQDRNIETSWVESTDI